MRENSLQSRIMEFAKGFIVSFVVFIFSLATGHAQPAPGENQDEDVRGANVSWEFGGHVGNILPNQIDGVEEIMGLGGIWLGFRTSDTAFLEIGTASGNGSGARWKNAFLSFRMEIPVENLIGTVSIGPDVTIYQGVGGKEITLGGGHVSGGVIALLGGNLWFRSDMKFNVNPGTSLYLGFGFLIRM